MTNIKQLEAARKEYLNTKYSSDEFNEKRERYEKAKRIADQYWQFVPIS